jgi:hypothetical protein
MRAEKAFAGVAEELPGKGGSGIVLMGMTPSSTGRRKLP